MIILGVSPNYMNYIVEESQAYRFHLQGYGTLSMAIDRLGRTNASEYYGFFLALDELPEKVDMVTKFIRLCNMISYRDKVKKRFVLAVKNNDRVSDLFKKDKFSNLDIYVQRFDIMTDLVIKKEIFGTILIGRLTPYGNNNEGQVDVSKFKPQRSLSYSPLFPAWDSKAIESVNLRGTLDETMIEDLYLDELRKSSEFHYALRRFGIAKEFLGNTNGDERVEQLIEETSDKSLKLQRSLLYKYVKEVGLNEK